MSIMMIHSIQQYAPCILSQYDSINSTAIEQWRQHGFEETKKFLEKVPENLRNEFMYTALLKKHIEKVVFKIMREIGLLLKPSPVKSIMLFCLGNRVKVDEILIEKKMCDEFVMLWADQKELADLHSTIPTMYRHKISNTTQICVGIGRGKIMVNRDTRFSKLILVGKDWYRVTMNVYMKVLSERSRFFMEKMSCRREKGVSHMVEIRECDDVDIYVDIVVLMYCDDLKKKEDENVNEILALLKVYVAILFYEGVMSCFEHLEAAPWSVDEEYIVVSCFNELYPLEKYVTLTLQRVSSEPTRARNNSELKKMLLAMTSKCIIDLEDIECSLDPMIEREVKRYQSNTEIKKEEKKDKKKEHGDNKRLKETEKKLLTSSGEKSRELEESKVEISWLKEKIEGFSKSQNSIEDDSSVQNFDIYSLKIEMDSTKESLPQAHAAAETSSLKVSDLLEEMKYVKNRLKEVTETEMKSKISMDD